MKILKAMRGGTPGVALFVVVLLLVPGLCFGGAKTGGTLKIAMYADATSLDPGGANDIPSQKAYNLLFDTLLTFDKGMQLTGHVATAWKPSQDSKIWTFTIRQGIKFHDGSTLTAEDVAFSFQRILDAPEAASQKKSSIAMIDGIEAKGAEVIFKLKYPFAPFPGTTAQIHIVPKKLAAEVGNRSFGSRPVGSGPFRYAEWIKDDHITLDRNDQYWLKRPNLDRVVLRPIPEGTVRAMSLMAGEVDVVDQVSSETLPKLQGVKGVELLTTPGLNYYWLGFRQYGPPYTSLKFRQMVYHAIDMDGAIKTIFPHGNAVRAYGAVPPLVWPHDDKYLKEHALRQDSAKAKKLFAELTAERVMRPDTRVLVSMPNDPERIKLGEILVTNLKEIGVNAELKVSETGSYIESAVKGTDPFIYSLFAVPRYLDPDAVFGWLFLSGPTGSTHGAKILGLAERDPKINDAVEKARVISDQGERSKLYVSLQRYVLTEKLYHIPAYYRTIVLGKRSAVQDLLPAPNDLFWLVTPFSNVWLDR
jgi:peptide/nickel transport system substrate-binding protein